GLGGGGESARERGGERGGGDGGSDVHVVKSPYGINGLDSGVAERPADRPGLPALHLALRNGGLEVTGYPITKS
ncbi:MAG: hypothetical protein WB647_20595, partial [Roseiarcus sp.]|uniref:hypothetical protein n=1 Tax=Roseiarcus sp. TaxID=1969460 RepID=UPI003C336C9C